jgi:uncharacterized protein YjgD (DUF1641 family)
MSEPATEIVDTPDEQALWREWEELWNRPGHREAVERTLLLLRSLNDRGLLDGAQAVVEGGNASSRALELFLVQSRNLRVARNARTLYEIFARIDLESLTRRAAGAGGPAGPPRPMGLLELRRRLRDPEVSAGLEVVLAALAQVGRARRAR